MINTLSNRLAPAGKGIDHPKSRGHRLRAVTCIDED